MEWLEELQDVTPFIDFGPRIGDIPDALTGADHGLSTFSVAQSSRG